MRRLNHPVYRNRVLQIVADAALIALAYFLAFQLRFLDDPNGWPQRYETLFAQSVGFVVAGKLVVFYAFGLYQKWWRYVSGRDFLLILRAVAVASALLVIVFAVAKPFEHALPRSVEVMDFLLTALLIAGARLAVRLVLERPSRGARMPKHEVLVVGAGSGGQMVVRELQLNPNLGATAIGFVDDDPRKRGMRMLGLKVLGSTKQIEQILDETKPNEVVIAIPSAPGTLRGRIVAACRDREIRVRTLPTVFELLRGGVQLNKQLREVQVEDVLGREPIVRELDRVGAYLRDRIVLVTGAGGSIGSELCRQIAQVKPRLLVMLDHAEDNLFQIDREMVEERHFASCEAVLADCKEPHRML
ncbi:MAG: polysaccharide biosynthesis protein, partial [Actinomycetota bacterium]|nr:polysaccharide biosynthesis protein [Actinomycetota bacterium]